MGWRERHRESRTVRKTQSSTKCLLRCGGHKKPSVPKVVPRFRVRMTEWMVGVPFSQPRISAGVDVGRNLLPQSDLSL